MKTYYHFHGETLRDGRPIPPIGEWLEHEGPLVPCESGLHSSEHPFDALKYAPGPHLDMVVNDGEMFERGNPVDKVCAQRRKRVATFNATELLWSFARWCALQVIDAWDAPPVVRQYLETGDETLRAAAAARVAARAAAWSAAWSAARSATADADRAVARDAAWAAARDAQRNKFKEMVEEAFANEIPRQDQ